MCIHLCLLAFSSWRGLGFIYKIDKGSFKWQVFNIDMSVSQHLVSQQAIHGLVTMFYLRLFFNKYIITSLSDAVLKNMNLFAVLIDDTVTDSD